jgi:hypothetical protein
MASLTVLSTAVGLPGNDGSNRTLLDAAGLLAANPSDHPVDRLG